MAEPAESKDFQKRNYPLPAYNFRVGVGGLDMSFSDVSGLRLDFETKAYRHGLSAWEGERIARYAWGAFYPITLKRGIVHGRAMLADWLEDGDRPRAMEISLCDEKGVPLVTWRVGRAVPVKLEAPEFAARSDEPAIESLEVMVSGIVVVHHR
jgi:phage tail-like protein